MLPSGIRQSFSSAERTKTSEAFHNICPHRGNKLAIDAKGSCRRFTCGFHGWTFDLQGELKGVPDENQFYDFDKSQHGLAPLSVDTWEGFLFVHLDRQPTETLAQQLADFGERLRGFPFHKMSVCYSWHAEIKCNWKVSMDAFHEGYHVPFVHGRTVPQSSASKDNPLAHPLKIILSPAGHRMMSFTEILTRQISRRSTRCFCGTAALRLKTGRPT